MADTVTNVEALVWKTWRQGELFMEKDGGIEKWENEGGGDETQTRATEGWRARKPGWLKLTGDGGADFRRLKSMESLYFMVTYTVSLCV